MSSRTGVKERTKRVLVVEDVATVALLIKESLAELGPDFEIETVASGEEGLRKMEREAWDLIVTDHRMAGMTGLEFIETVKEKAPATLTILMTGYGTDELQRAAQRLNVYHYMTKPFPLADLRRIIQDAFALKRNSCDADSDSPPPERDSPPLKVTLGGDGAVGKTALVRRLCTGRFDGTRTMTIGVDFHLYDVRHRESTTRLIVWDVSGQDHFAFTRRAFYRGSKAVGLVYAVNDRSSFERLARWHDEVRASLPRAPLVLAGNKTDLERVVSVEEGQALAAEWGVPFFETSCAIGQGVYEFFSTLADAAMKNNVKRAA